MLAGGLCLVAGFGAVGVETPRSGALVRGPEVSEADGDFACRFFHLELPDCGAV
jgi:hypothetical protein